MMHQGTAFLFPVSDRALRGSECARVQRRGSSDPRGRCHPRSQRLPLGRQHARRADLAAVALDGGGRAPR